MSRIGKLPIPVPKGVDVSIKGADVTVKGAKGTLQRTFRDVEIAQEDGQLVVRPTRNDRQGRAFHGLARALLNNMVVGVSEGFKRTLEIVGTGYRAEGQGQTLVLNVGYSHPVTMELPKTISAKVDRTTIELESSNKELLGQICAEIRRVRPPEPYKGKGIRYAGEVIQMKAGKAGK